MEEYFKIFGVNGTVFGVVTLTDVELVLKITLLLITIAWTTGKAIEQWRNLKTKD